MISIYGVVGVLGVSARIVQTYSPTWASAHVWRNRVDGRGVGFGAIFEDIREANTCALIVCSSCNVSQFLAMYECKWAQVSW
jgi:hypothetical protein